MGQDTWKLENKICLVTGSNSGIGRQTSLGLAMQGARVIMACRNKERGQKALEEIVTKSGNTNVELMILDLASLESICKFVKNFKNKYKNLHVLINNAGIHNLKRTETVDGFESNFGVNYLGPFYLTNQLLDLIKSSAPSRIINVSSHYFKYASINFDDLQSKKEFKTSLKTGSIPYCKSKLALALFTFKLAERLKNTGVTVNCLCPGFVKKDPEKQGKSPNFILKLGIRLATGRILIKYKTPEEGAKTSIYLASSNKVQGITGKFFENEKISNKYDKYFNMAIAKSLWDASEKLTGLKT